MTDGSQDPDRLLPPGHGRLVPLRLPAGRPATEWAPPGPPPPAPPATSTAVVIPAGYALVPDGFRLVPIPPPGQSAAPPPGQRPGQPLARPPARPSPGPRPGPPDRRRPAQPAPGDRTRPVATRPTPVPASNPAARTQAPFYVLSTSITILGVLLLTFAADVLLVGAIRHARDQSIAYSQLRSDLANGTAAVNQLDQEGKPIPLGTALGVIDIEWLGMREVFLEGTTSGVLQSGAGHRRDTPMPGQPGTSVIFGRQTAFGGPFGGLDKLVLGGRLKIVTGQGESNWRVVAIRQDGDPTPPALVQGGARVTLVTADGPAFLPHGALRVDADMITGVDAAGKTVSPFPSGARPLTVGYLAPSERVMAGDDAAWLGMITPLLVLLPVSVAVGWARYSWGRWQTWIAGVPLLLATGLAMSDQMAQLLPNVL